MCVPRSIDPSTTTPIKSRLKSVLGSILPTSIAIIIIIVVVVVVVIMIIIIIIILSIIIINECFDIVNFFCYFQDSESITNSVFALSCRTRKYVLCS